ncbi:MAG TPA: polymer-forming cytoskeletal protein [Lacibacter sp.]|nr:polymer-forming cytoskeletal protein [Lacibacter sp.]
MFSNKTNNSKETAGGLATIIAAGTEIKGDIQSKGDIRVDGTLTGNLSTTSKVIIGTNGKVNGDVQANTADVLGQINGNVKVAELLYLKDDCEVNGNIYTGQLQVDASAKFNGECHMGAAAVAKSNATANVVAIKNEPVHAAANDQ